MSLHMPVSCTMKIVSTIIKDFLYARHSLGVGHTSFHLIVLIFYEIDTVVSLIYT